VKYFVEVRTPSGGDAARQLEATVEAAHAHLAGDPAPPATLDGGSDAIVRLLRVGAEVKRVEVRRLEGRGRYALVIDGFRYEVEALDERARAIRDLAAATAGPSGPAPLTAPMPGLIVRVNVAPGDVVAAGQGLVVMEAMKMENELRTQAAGTVRAVLVQPGAVVEKGARLVELE
jgi:pyruvate carboxylase subunit B